MRITSQGPSVDFTSASQVNYSKPQVASQTKNATENAVTNESGETNSTLEQHRQFVEEQLATNEDIPQDKVKEAVKSLNKFMETNNTESKFIFHEGLDKYYVQMVDKETQEVVKEIPSKKLLDAFYEMQKLVGMVVDEKI